MDEVSSGQLLHKGNKKDEEEIVIIIEKANNLLFKGHAIKDERETKLFEMREYGIQRGVHWTL